MAKPGVGARQAGSAPIVPASPGIGVSEEISAACKLELADVESEGADQDQSELGALDNKILSEIAACVTTGPLSGRALDLVSHLESSGEHKRALLERRAGIVREYLSSLGVGENKLVVSPGESLDTAAFDASGSDRERRVDISLH